MITLLIDLDAGCSNLQIKKDLSVILGQGRFVLYLNSLKSYLGIVNILEVQATAPSQLIKVTYLCLSDSSYCFYPTHELKQMK